jgi:large subunit ribosomal protein L29
MKNKEIVSLSEQELKDKITEGQADLNKMKLNHAVSPIENPVQIRLTRRNVARLKTEVNKRNKGAK